MLLLFFQNFGFSGCKGGGGGKGQKVAQNDKKNLSHSISQELPHMIMVFGTHVYNDDISSNFFFIFSKF